LIYIASDDRRANSVFRATQSHHNSQVPATRSSHGSTLSEHRTIDAPGAAARENKKEKHEAKKHRRLAAVEQGIKRFGR
jgi:hypothetical protein